MQAASRNVETGPDRAPCASQGAWVRAILSHWNQMPWQNYKTGVSFSCLEGNKYIRAKSLMWHSTREGQNQHRYPVRCVPALQELAVTIQSPALSPSLPVRRIISHHPEHLSNAPQNRQGH